MEKYEKSKDFENEVIEGAYNAFQLKFAEYKKKVNEAFLEHNLDGTVAIEPK